MKKILLLLVICVSLMACENPRSRSGQRGTEKNLDSLKVDCKLEKVVIILLPTQGQDMTVISEGVYTTKMKNHYLYKVKRIEKNVVAFAYIPNLYSLYDTVLVPVIRIQ